MIHLYNLLVVALVLLNVTGLTLFARPFVRLPYALAQAAAVIALCLGFFFVEHYVGLGKLGWLLLPGSAASAWMIARRWPVLRANLWANAWLLVGFFYCLAWRYLFPNIDASTERMADLGFVADYAQGVQLPPPDLWFPPYTLNHYYSLQHYAAALLGRLAGLGPGVSYHMAYCLLTGLTMASAYEAVRLLCARRWVQILILMAFLAGGTGASVFTPFMIKNPRENETAWCSMRFIGTTTSFDDAKLTRFGRWIKSFTPARDQPEQVQDLPMETLSYVVELGDYHAPLGGNFMLAISLGAAALLLRRPLPEPPPPDGETLAESATPLPLAPFSQSLPGENTAAHALLAATLPLTLATNTWTLPFQAALAFGCLCYVWLERRAWPNWLALLGGAAGATMLLFPFLSYFLPLNVGNNAPMRRVPTELHTPAMYFLIVFWPVLIVCALHLIFAPWKRKLLSLFWLGALAFTEMFFIDDIYSGSSERFNSTLKWWPWVFNGVLLVVAAANLDQPWPGWRPVRDTALAAVSRGRRAKPAWREAASALSMVGTTLTLLLVLTYMIRLGTSWFDEAKKASAVAKQVGQPTAFGQLDGAAWLRYNLFYSKEVNRGVTSLLAFLKTQPRGVLVEKPDDRAFTQVGAFSLFTGLPSLIGWTSHENLWRNDQSDIETRYNKINDLYAGILPDPLRYLDAHQVRYILWLPRNNKLTAPDALPKLQARLSQQYDWNEFCRSGNDVVGVWVRR